MIIFEIVVELSGCYYVKSKKSDKLLKGKLINSGEYLFR